MYFSIGVCLFMVFPPSSLTIHPHCIGYGDLHQHNFLIYIFCFKCNHMFDGSIMPIAHQIFGGLRLKVLGVYPKEMQA